MTTHNNDQAERLARDELDELRARVDCRTVLEAGGWELDAKESTRGAIKYRNGAGRIVIVTHEGKGWFDPLNDRRGDALALAQYVWGGMAFLAPHLRVAKTHGTSKTTVQTLDRVWMLPN